VSTLKILEDFQNQEIVEQLNKSILFKEKPHTKETASLYKNKQSLAGISRNSF
jgi:exopolysaccharide biosynthesis predicted pyruvyltransferase EpsI